MTEIIAGLKELGKEFQSQDQLTNFFKIAPYNPIIITDLIEIYKALCSDLSKLKLPTSESIQKYILNTIEFFFESKWESIQESELPQLFYSFLFETCYPVHLKFTSTIRLRYAEILALYFLLTQNMNEALIFISQEANRYIRVPFIRMLAQKMCVDPNYKPARLQFIENADAQRYFIDNIWMAIEGDPSNLETFKYLAAILPDPSWSYQYLAEINAPYAQIDQPNFDMGNLHAFTHYIEMYIYLILKINPDLRMQFIEQNFPIDRIDPIIEKAKENPDMIVRVKIYDNYARMLYMLYIYTEYEQYIQKCYAILQFYLDNQIPFSSDYYVRLISTYCLDHPEFIEQSFPYVIYYIREVSVNPTIENFETILDRAQTSFEFIHMADIAYHDLVSQVIAEFLQEIDITNISLTCSQLILCYFIVVQNVSIDIKTFMNLIFVTMKELLTQEIDDKNAELPMYANILLYTKILSVLQINDEMAQNDYNVALALIPVHLVILLNVQCPVVAANLVLTYILDKIKQYPQLGSIFIDLSEQTFDIIERLDPNYTKLVSAIAIAYSRADYIEQFFQKYYEMLNDIERTEKIPVVLNGILFMNNLIGCEFPPDQLEGIETSFNNMRQVASQLVNIDESGRCYAEYIRSLRCICGLRNLNPERLEIFIDEMNIFISTQEFPWCAETIIAFIENVLFLLLLFIKEKSFYNVQVDYVYHCVEFVFEKMTATFPEFFAPTISQAEVEDSIVRMIRSFRELLMYIITSVEVGNKNFIEGMPMIPYENVEYMTHWAGMILEKYNLTHDVNKIFIKFLCTLSRFERSLIPLSISKIFEFCEHRSFDPNRGETTEMINSLVPYIFTNPNSPFAVDPDAFTGALQTNEGPAALIGAEAAQSLIENLEIVKQMPPEQRIVELHIRMRKVLNIAFRFNTMRL